MRVLVTGAGGFLGSHIAKMLVQNGHEVSNFSRNIYPFLEKLGIANISGDLSNYKEVEKAFLGMEAIIHVASKVGMWGSWSEFYNTNVVGTQNVIQACKSHGIKKLVYTSTPSVVFGKSDLLGVDEKQEYPKSYLTYYAKTKAKAEAAVLGANDSTTLATVSLRPHLIYGPGDPNLIPKIVERARLGKLKIVGDGSNLVDIIYVENAAWAHLKALDALDLGSPISGKAYFLGQERPVNLWDFINEILSIYGIAPLSKKISFGKAYTIGAMLENMYKLFNITKKEPAMTRFIALSLAKSHYFDHKNAANDLSYDPQISIELSLEKISQDLKNKTSD